MWGLAVPSPPPHIKYVKIMLKKSHYLVGYIYPLYICTGNEATLKTNIMEQQIAIVGVILIAGTILVKVAGLILNNLNTRDDR